jgi:predicted nucleotidyltransferase
MVEQKYIDYWRSRQAQRQAQVEIWEKAAWAEAKTAAALLREQFGATSVIVFGSLVRGRFGENSDIDLAVAGISKGDFFSALAAVNAHSQRQIDLKPMESLEPRFKARVMSTGKAIDANL